MIPARHLVDLFRRWQLVHGDRLAIDRPDIAAWRAQVVLDERAVGVEERLLHAPDGDGLGRLQGPIRRARAADPRPDVVPLLEQPFDVARHREGARAPVAVLERHLGAVDFLRVQLRLDVTLPRHQLGIDAFLNLRGRLGQAVEQRPGAGPLAHLEGRAGGALLLQQVDVEIEIAAHGRQIRGPQLAALNRAAHRFHALRGGGDRGHGLVEPLVLLKRQGPHVERLLQLSRVCDQSAETNRLVDLCQRAVDVASVDLHGRPRRKQARLSHPVLSAVQQRQGPREQRESAVGVAVGVLHLPVPFERVRVPGLVARLLVQTERVPDRLLGGRPVAVLELGDGQRRQRPRGAPGQVQAPGDFNPAAEGLDRLVVQTEAEIAVAEVHRQRTSTLAEFTSCASGMAVCSCSMASSTRPSDSINTPELFRMSAIFVGSFAARASGSASWK